MAGLLLTYQQILNELKMLTASYSIIYQLFTIILLFIRHLQLHMLYCPILFSPDSNILGRSINLSIAIFIMTLEYLIWFDDIDYGTARNFSTQHQNRFSHTLLHSLPAFYDLRQHLNELSYLYLFLPNVFALFMTSHYLSCIS